jgi:hypothetical protein
VAQLGPDDSVCFTDYVASVPAALKSMMRCRFYAGVGGRQIGWGICAGEDRPDLTSDRPSDGSHIE